MLYLLTGLPQSKTCFGHTKYGSSNLHCLGSSNSACLKNGRGKALVANAASNIGAAYIFLRKGYIYIAMINVIGAASLLMGYDWHQFWIFVAIVCPLVGLAGFIDAVAGGGGLISLPAYLIAGLPADMAKATNKLSSGLGTAVATVRYAVKGFVNWKIAPFCIAFALCGSFLGAELTLLISDTAFKIAMLAILPIVAIIVLMPKSLREIPLKPAFSFPVTAAIASAISLVIGVYDGCFGPGTGTFMLILFTMVDRMTLADANGLSKIANFSTNVAANILFIARGYTFLFLGVIAGVFGIAGNYLGTVFFVKKGVKGTKIIIIVVIVIFFVKTLLELCGVI